jgi:nucleoside-diphosphate-sugar epimerase
MKVLFIGGTGVISSACSQLAVERGYELYLLNRGKTDRAVPGSVHWLQADARDKNSLQSALSGRHFDAVVQWIGFVPEHLEVDIELMRGRVGQYIFISSASAYQKPPTSLPVTESTPLHNPFWEYSRNKIACEQRLMRAYVEQGFPVTIVRPSHTYDRTMVPISGRYTILNRMLQGRKVLVHGDGTSLWTLTHHKDFAVGFTGLLGEQRAIGEAYHITSDEWLSWNQIYTFLAKAAGVEPKLVHVPSEFIAAFDPEWGAGLLGDKAHSAIFDNSKIKKLVPEFSARIPFSQGAREIIDWYTQDESRQVIDERLDRTMDRVIEAYESALPE